MKLNIYFQGGAIILAAVILLTFYFTNIGVVKEDFLAAFSFKGDSDGFTYFSQIFNKNNRKTPSPTNTPSPTQTATVSASPSPSFSATPIPSPSQSPTPRPSQSVTPSVTPSRTPTPSVSPTASASPSPNTSVSPSASPTLSPTPTSNAVLWGAYVGDATWDAADFESQTGKKMNMQAIFVGFSDPLPVEFGPTVRDQGKTLVIFWEPYNTNLDNIISGNSDTYIKQFASAAKTYAGPIILAPLHEMNGDWDPWDGTVGTNTPAKVIAAWKRIHDLFASVTNVKFGWAVNNESVPNTTANKFENYYPGDAYVDYVGVDGFNWGNPWENFSQVFDNALSRLVVYKKPIYIFSFACADGTQKPAWITDALTVQIPKHPQIAGWVWFNQNKEKNWLVWSDSNSLSAFKAGLP